MTTEPVGGQLTAVDVKAAGLEAGLRAVGITSAEPFLETRQILEERRAQGLHDTMAFTYRNPERSTTPPRILETAETIVVGARAYPSTQPPTAVDQDRQGRIASYAWTDHYAELRHGLETMADLLRAAGWTARVVADDNALVDRAAAVRAGIGWFGKNSNVLLPSAGSFFVLGSVVTDAPLDQDLPLETDCGSCRRCLDGCPTAAIIAPGVVDARRCLAWLLQKEGSFPVEFREALGGRIYGCDDCQEVCPPSRVNAGDRDEVGAQPIALTSRDVRRRTADGARDSSQADLLAVVDLVELLQLDDAELVARHGRWYIPRRDMNYVRRNALLALANAAAGGGPDSGPDSGIDSGIEVAGDVVACIASFLMHPDPMLRAHAVWAVRRIGHGSLAEQLREDSAPMVREELARQ